jgi:hypothetical protein
MNETKQQRGESKKHTRKHRSRPMPKWLKEKQELDEMARRRVLMVLSVLSGERPVTEVITESGMTRNTYYQLEEKALDAMLTALGPTPPGRKPDQSAELVALKAKVDRLEQEKRRVERLLLLTRKVVKPGPLTMPGRGRPPSTSSGSGPSPSSATTSPASGPGSTPTTAGAAGR